MPEVDNETRVDRRKVGVFERHLQTAAFTVMVLLLSWIGKTTYDTSLEVSVLSEKFNGYVELGNRMNDALEDRCAAMEARISGLHDRQDMVESRVMRLELTGCEVCPNQIMGPGIHKGSSFSKRKTDERATFSE